MMRDQVGQIETQILTVNSTEQSLESSILHEPVVFRPVRIKNGNNANSSRVEQRAASVQETPSLIQIQP